MKVKINDILNELHHSVDSFIADDFYKGIKRCVDKSGKIDLDDAEVQLYIRDFMEELDIRKDYQAADAKKVLELYYDKAFDDIEELEDEDELGDHDIDFEYQSDRELDYRKTQNLLKNKQEKFLGASDDVIADSKEKGLYSEAKISLTDSANKIVESIKSKITENKIELALKECTYNEKLLRKANLYEELYKSITKNTEKLNEVKLTEDSEIEDMIETLIDDGYDIEDEEDLMMGIGADLGVDRANQKRLAKQIQKVYRTQKDKKGESRITEDEELNSEIEIDEDKSVLDLLQDRIGQNISVGELNSLLQSIFARYNEVFLLNSDLYNMNLEDTQELTVFDDEDMYVIKYDIIDMDNSIIQITDVTIE